MPAANTPSQHRCGLCGQVEVVLVDSHIFPRWMGKDLRAEGGPLLLVPTTDAVQPAPIWRHGEYDQIVCHPCESSFGPADQYFASFRRKRDEALRVEDGDRTLAYGYPDADAALIQRFFLTCLYRAHLAKRPMPEDVDLGKVGERLREHLLDEPGSSSDFDVVLFRETHLLSETMIVPKRERIGKANGYRVGVPGFSAIIRTDQRPMPSEITSFALGKTPGVALAQHEIHPKLWDSMLRAQGFHGPKLSRLVDKFR